MPAISARGQAAQPSGRGLRSAARRGRPTACSVNRTLATGGAAGDWCYARAGRRPRSVRTRGISWGGLGGTPRAPGAGGEGRAGRRAGRAGRAGATLLMLRFYRGARAGMAAMT